MKERDPLSDPIWCSYSYSYSYSESPQIRIGTRSTSTSTSTSTRLDGTEALAATLRRAVPGLRSAVLFGSTLSPATCKPTSIPDVFALVEDLDEALAGLGVSPLGRRLARGLAPITVALGAEIAGRTIAKLNLATPAQVRDALARPRDLSLAGRLAKKTRLMVVRDGFAGAELASLLDGAVEAMAGAATLGLPRQLTLDEAARRCFALSYRAEPRPEGTAQIAARFDAFAAEYHERYQPRLAAIAAERGIEVIEGALIDGRPEAVRRRERRALSRLLWQSRLRALLRWGRQPLLYRGWFPYLVGKLRRAWG